MGSEDSTLSVVEHNRSKYCIAFNKKWKGEKEKKRKFYEHEIIQSNTLQTFRKIGIWCLMAALMSETCCDSSFFHSNKWNFYEQQMREMFDRDFFVLIQFHFMLSADKKKKKKNTMRAHDRHSLRSFSFSPCIECANLKAFFSLNFFMVERLPSFLCALYYVW